MRFLIELDGVVLDLEPAWYRAHTETAKAVGWSWLDQGRFWRLMRKEGRTANVLPASKPHKLADYQSRFAERIDTDELLADLAPHDDAGAAVAALNGYGAIQFLTTGRNLNARFRALQATGWPPPEPGLVSLNPDVRRRPGELKTLASDDPRTLVVAGSDDVVRAAGEAGLLAVGISSGACIAARLHQAGADLVYTCLAELRSELDAGGHELIRAGLLPAPM